MIKIPQNSDNEALRCQLLDEIYAGAMAGMPAMLVDEEQIRNGDREELEKIAERYGLR